jgi:hypothetical protein
LIPALACNITCKESSSICGEWPDFNDKAKNKNQQPVICATKTCLREEAGNHANRISGVLTVKGLEQTIRHLRRLNIQKSRMTRTYTSIDVAFNSHCCEILSRFLLIRHHLIQNAPRVPYILSPFIKPLTLQLQGRSKSSLRGVHAWSSMVARVWRLPSVRRRCTLNIEKCAKRVLLTLLGSREVPERSNNPVKRSTTCFPPVTNPLAHHFNIHFPIHHSTGFKPQNEVIDIKV